MVCEYILKSCFMGNDTGVVSSTRLSCPPGFITRQISANPLSRSWKLRMPKADVAASNVLSGNDMAKQSSFLISTFPSRCACFTFSLATFSIPSDMSMPTIFSGQSAWAAKMAKSPVPVAMSSMRLGFRAPTV